MNRALSKLFENDRDGAYWAGILVVWFAAVMAVKS